MYTEKLQLIIDSLTACLDDTVKFDTGNDVAGKRIRKNCNIAKNELQQFRKQIQEERNNRKA